VVLGLVFGRVVFEGSWLSVDDSLDLRIFGEVKFGWCGNHFCSS
jgi:hypothetical protein